MPSTIAKAERELGYAPARDLAAGLRSDAGVVFGQHAAGGRRCLGATTRLGWRRITSDEDASQVKLRNRQRRAGFARDTTQVYDVRRIELDTCRLSRPCDSSIVVVCALLVLLSIGSVAHRRRRQTHRSSCKPQGSSVAGPAAARSCRDVWAARRARGKKTDQKLEIAGDRAAQERPATIYRQ